MNVHVLFKTGKEVVFKAAEYVDRGAEYIVQRHMGVVSVLGHFPKESVAGIWYESA